MSDKPQVHGSGVYRIERGEVNTYLLNDDESYITIIDTGFPGTVHRVMQLVSNIGRVPQEVRNILITHADLDHIGDLNALVNATGARVYASAKAQVFIHRRRSPPHLRLPTRLIAASIGFFMLKAVAVDHVVADGDMLDIAGGIHVIATPGHTPDHVSYFWQRERMLFAGDLIRNLANGLSLTPAQWSHDMIAARRSACRVLSLNPAVICPGHGQIWTASQAPGQIELLRNSLACQLD
jgi:glyoxylase-like metal-dependent hydrolase (beta-lactamase superfamily II)